MDCNLMLQLIFSSQIPPMLVFCAYLQLVYLLVTELLSVIGMSRCDADMLNMVTDTTDDNCVLKYIIV